MTQAQIIEGLKAYISEEVLDGQDIGLVATTPLIEWGVLNSMEIAGLVRFIQVRFGVDLPSETITLEHFQSLDALSRLVIGERQG